MRNTVATGNSAKALDLSTVKNTSRPIAANEAAALWDVGDGVLNLELTTKSNALTQSSFDIFERAMDEIETPGSAFAALVIYSESPNFAAGADLKEFAALVAAKDWPTMQAFAQRGQDVLWRMRHAAFPVVSALQGAALGGGCEIVLHSSAVVAHEESYIGLVESTVGIVPAWGGCAGLLARHYEALGGTGEPAIAIERTFDAISGARTGARASQAKDLLFLRADDEIITDSAALFERAKDKALSLVGNVPAQPTLPFALPGEAGRAALMAKAPKDAGPHDLIVWDALAALLTGGAHGAAAGDAAETILAGEVRSAMALFKTAGTKARIDHMLATRQPLKN
ncbi:MAG: enoyl-CoA hydratase/isomerase family protein [Pseudomonadota bacterium]